MLYEEYIYAMGSLMQKNDNLAKMLDGLYLLDNQDKERFIEVVDTLDYTDKQVKKSLFNDIMDQREKKESRVQRLKVNVPL
jgi:hypothetical protein